MSTVSTVSNVGLGLVTGLLLTSAIKYIGYGTGVTASAVGDTALLTPAAEARTSSAQTQQTTNTTSDSYQLVGAIVCTSTAKAITEVGVFDASTGSNLLFRSTFDAVNLSVADSITFTIKLVFDQA